MEKFKEILKRLNAPTQKVRCCKCGKEMEMPNPPSKVIYSWGCSSAVIFMVANLIVNGWHIRNRGVTDNHPIFCQDCWDNKEPEYIKLPLADEWVEKGKEWLRNTKEELLKSL